jgi:tetratricopeptide (TPR) repeat protein
VLGGSVRRAGDRVRITAQLSDVSNGYQLWSERYDRELKDIFDVQDEIARAIAERLKVTLSGRKDERVVGQGTSNVEAYELYLKGRALLYRRGSSIPPALELFRKAVELDPEYAAAWAGAADAYTVLAYFGFVRGPEARPQALAAANRAIELDPGSADGYTALACARLLYDNDRAGARQAFERALELNPNYGQGRCWYALFYLQWACGELGRGVAEARLALERDPLSAYVMMIVSVCLLTSGQVDEAIEQAQKAVRTDPESFVSYWELGTAQAEAGRLDEAIATLQHAAAMSHRHPFATSGLVSALAAAGQQAEAVAVHREMVDRASRGYVPSTHLAVTAQAIGEHDHALAYARRAWADREPPFILLARQHVTFRSLRQVPAFQEILREMDAGTA